MLYPFELRAHFTDSIVALLSLQIEGRIAEEASPTGPDAKARSASRSAKPG
jgi:hypothetical protein